MHHDIKNILVIILKHIGDVLLTYPVYNNLRANFPDARIILLVNKGTEEVISDHPCIDEIITIPRNSSSLIERNLLLPLNIFKKNIDLVFDLCNSDRSALLSFLSNARYRVAFYSKKGLKIKNKLHTHIYEQNESIHTVEKNLKLLRLFGLKITYNEVLYHIKPHDLLYVQNLLTDRGIREYNYIHIHPVSRWLFKCWDNDRWAKIIDYIISKGFKVVLTSSNQDQEREIIYKILSKVKNQDSIISFLGNLTLKQLGAVSRFARLFLGIDTAPMHIAAAVGTPVVALFGGGINQWKPYGNNHIVIYKPTYEVFKENRETKIRENLLNINENDVIDILYHKFSI